MKTAFSAEQIVTAASVVPNVPLAISEMKIARSWQVTKANGGLGVSPAQSTIHINKAIVALGGTP